MTQNPQTAIITPGELLAHWQGHRRLTRRMTLAFPEDQLFSFSPAPPMRPFGELAWEMHRVAAYTLDALRSGDWSWPSARPPEPPRERDALLAAWDDLSARLDSEWVSVPLSIFPLEQDIPWGRQTAMSATLYAIDNEIHHRGQGYVYLRALGLEPPPFWER